MSHNFQDGECLLAGAIQCMEKNPRELLHCLLFLSIQFCFWLFVSVSFENIMGFPFQIIDQIN